MAKCLKRKCPLYGQREVPYSGSTKSKIVAVGESPGHQEVLEGVPFYEFAPAGELARDACSKVGLDWNDLFLANSARCLIDKNRMSNKAITQTLAYCRPKLCFALQALAPKALVLFGGYALRQVLRRGGITKARGIWVWSDEFDCWCMPTFHPAYICRNPGLMKLLVNDLSKVADFVENGYEIRTEEEDVDYKEVDSPFPFVKPGQTIGIDTEDTGLDWLSPNFIVVSYSISWEEGKAIHIVLYEESEEKEADFSILVDRVAEGEKKAKPTTVWVKKKPNFEKRLADLRSVLEDQTIKKYMMNGPFDVHAFNALCRRENVPPMKVAGWAMDIQASAHVLDENVFKMSSLRDLQGAFTDCRSEYKGELKNDGVLIEDILGSDPIKLKDYASFDADMTRRVGISEKDDLLRPENRRLANYVVKFVTPVLQHVIVPMEEHGIFIDAKAMPSVRNETKTELDALSETAIQCIKKKVRDGHEEKGLRLTRDDLLRDALFSKDGFDLEPVKKTKGKEKWSVDKEVRTRLLDRKRPPKKAKEFLETYNKWTDLDQLRKKLGEIEKFLTPDSRIHTHLSMVIAVTGRLSSSKPNLMNIPKRSPLAKKIRRLIAAPPGKLLLAADAEQNELRWFADIANETEMLKVFKAGKDIHLATAMSLVSKPIDQWTKEELELYRRNSKSVNFGLIYGMMAKGFVRYAKVEYNIDLTEKEALRWKQIFFRRYPGIPLYHKQAVQDCKLKGYVESPLGRRRRLPDIYSENKYIAWEAARQAINHPTQNIGSDAVLLADKEIRIKDYFDPEECRDVLFIHDELIFEVADNSKVEDHAKIIKFEMENPPIERDFGYKPKVMPVTGIKVGKNLAEMEELRLQ